MEHPVSLSQLPAEMLEQVLVKVDRATAKNCRLVNKTWKSILDKKYPNWALVLDDDCPYLQFWLSCPIKSVRIARFTKPLDFSPTGHILSHPQNLERLIMEAPADYIMNDPRTHYENQLPEISPQNLTQLLGCPNLKEISLLLLSPELVESVDPATHDFKSMKKLQVHFIFGDLDARKALKFVETAFMKHVNEQFGLNSIIFIVDYSSEMRLHQVSMYFTLAISHANWEGLPHFEFKVRPFPAFGRSGYSGRDLNHISEPAGPSSSLETLKIAFYRNCSLAPFYNQMMLKQTQLVNLDMSEGTSVGVNPFMETVLKNCTTLVSIRVKTLVVYQHRVEGERTLEEFNLYFFQNCVNLQTLELGTEEVGKEMAEAANLIALPPQIRELSLTKFLILSKELEAFGKAIPCPKLEKFELKGCGRKGVFGVGEKALKSFLNMPILKKLCVVEGSINVSGGGESKTFREVLKHLGCPGPNYYRGFQCERDGVGHWSYEDHPRVLVPTGFSGMVE